MATSTTDKTILDSVWTEIAGNASETVSGFMTVFGDSKILYRQDVTLPGVEVTNGHWLEPASDAVNFLLLAGEFAYARSDGPQALLVVTLDG